ncbi:MAG TPA: hypothetical protein VJI15_00020 [Candidatus Nanoarchaeia archaeon]|nr:hypothetical protein [Candidatus Nanoarchaeia archaeon]
MRKLSPKEIYDHSAAEGLYEEAHLDKEEASKALEMIQEDYEFAQRMKKDKKPSWRVIFNAYYDAFRELCDQLMRFKKQKSSNHQAVFAFIALHFKDLNFDWELLEQIRTVRNNNKYQNLNISKEMWKSVELPFEMHIAALKKELEKRIGEL